ncbi:hypothetical protein [Sphingomonas arantia]
MDDAMLFTSICKKLERSARNGGRLHLTAEESRALIMHPAYAAILEAKTDELIASWGGERRVTHAPCQTGHGTSPKAEASDPPQLPNRRGQHPPRAPDRAAVEAAVTRRAAEVVASTKRRRGPAPPAA